MQGGLHEGWPRIGAGLVWRNWFPRGEEGIAHALGLQSSSAGVWSKSAAAYSSSQGSTTEPVARAGVRGGALGGRPMHSRMRFATAGSVIAAITRIEWPHSHRRASTPNTRFNKSAQGRRRGRTEGTGRGVTACRVGRGALPACASCEAPESHSLAALGSPSGAVIFVAGPVSASGGRHVRVGSSAQ
jgi:hypothetical protein